MRNTLFAALVALALHAPAHAAGTSEGSAPLSGGAANDATAAPSSVADSTPTSRDSERSADRSVLRHFDVEVDPFAYLARGHSLHLGFRFSRLRLDLGSFSMVVPEFVHGQPGFEDQGSGYGFKVDAYLLEAGKGPFVGAEGAWFEQELIDLSTQERAEVSSLLASGRVGWEFELGAGLYARPWVGVGYRFGNDTVKLPNATFEQTPIMVFPTIHLGYVFR